MKAMDSLLNDVIDYAGLFPPSKVDMASAVANFRSYQQGAFPNLLGRFVIGLDRVSEFQESAGAHASVFPLTIVAPRGSQWGALHEAFDSALTIASIEMAVDSPAEITAFCSTVPASVREQTQIYFEVPLHALSEQVATLKLLDAIQSVGARAKLRMGGVVEAAFPSSESLIAMLLAVSQRGLAFKATAGLHHPVRSHHPYTYEPNSPGGIMHGFINLYLAAALLHFGGSAEDGTALLNEEDTTQWRVSEEEIAWRDHMWSATQLQTVRTKFAGSFGSCSFDEPIHDLLTLGWL